MKTLEIRDKGLGLIKLTDRDLGLRDVEQSVAFARVFLENIFEVLDRVIGLVVQHTDSSPEHQRLDIVIIDLQKSVDLLTDLCRIFGIEIYLPKAIPRPGVVGRFFDYLQQCRLGGIGPISDDIKLGKIQAALRTVFLNADQFLIGDLGLVVLTRAYVKIRDRLVSLDICRLGSDSISKLHLGLRISGGICQESSVFDQPDGRTRIHLDALFDRILGFAGHFAAHVVTREAQICLRPFWVDRDRLVHFGDHLGLGAILGGQNRGFQHVALDKIRIDGDDLLLGLFRLVDQRRLNQQKVISEPRLGIKVFRVELNGPAKLVQRVVEAPEIFIRACEPPMSLCRVLIVFGGRAELHHRIVELALLEVLFALGNELFAGLAAAEHKKTHEKQQRQLSYADLKIGALDVTHKLSGPTRG